jgi:ribokinase
VNWKRHSDCERILVVGAVNVDRFYSVPSLEQFRSLSWWPRTGERALSQKQRATLDRFIASSSDVTPIIACGGGQAANYAVAGTACGVQTALFSAVGMDSAASIALEDLDGVDLSFLHRSNRTAEAIIFVEPSGDRDILISPSDQPMPARTDTLSNIHWTHIHFTSLPLAEHVELQVQIAELMSQRAGRSLDIGALYAEMGRRRLAKLLHELDLLFATELELKTFTGLPLPKAIETLFSDGVETVCCKRGAAGAKLYSSSGNVLECIAPAVQSVDSTGAGDVFAAVFVAARLKGVSDLGALRVATSLASSSVGAPGRRAYPSAKDFSGALQREGFQIRWSNH